MGEGGGKVEVGGRCHLTDTHSPGVVGAADGRGGRGQGVRGGVWEGRGKGHWGEG